MGKVTKVRSPLKSVPLSQEVLAKVNALRSEGSAQFLKKEFAKAAEHYDQAVRLLPDGAAEKAELLTKKCGCLLQLKKYKEVVKDASSVLEIQPNLTAALKARAKAYEQQGLLTKALADVQAVNKTDAATAETREMETRLKDTVSGRNRPSSAPAARESARTAQRADQYQITIKATLGSESRFIYTSFGISYPELLEQVHAKFPNAGPVVLKYADKEGDYITITSRQDIQAAMNDMVMAFQRHVASMQNKMSMPPHLPPVKIVVVPVPSEADVPRAPANEVAERANGKGAEIVPEPYQPDDWMLDFVRTFSEVTGLDPQQYMEHHQHAQDKLTRSMVETIHSEAAEPIFDEVEAHFRDAVCTSFVQWGNVSIVRADRKLQKLLSSNIVPGSDEWDSSPLLQDAMALFDKTEGRIREALKYYPEFSDGIASLGTVETERLKARLGFVLPQLINEEASSRTPEEHQQHTNRLVSERMSKVAKEKILKEQASMDKISQIFEEAFKLAEKAHRLKVAKDLERAGKDAAKLGLPPPEPPAADTLPFNSPPANILVMHGNALYDWSQMLAASGAAPWRPVLDAAAAKFRASGAPEADVRGALKNHPRAAELDLGPDPEPTAPSTPAGKDVVPAAPTETPSAPPAEKKEAKGLPSLEVKKKATAAPAK